jgi:Cdc6-like AAA superfamily ATPase
MKIDLLHASHCKTSKLLLIGISNTDECDDKSFMHRILFETYGEKELCNILNSLTNKLFDSKAITMIASTCSREGIM